MYTSIEILVLIVLCLLTCDAAKIIGIFNHPGKSHTHLGKVLLQNLAKRGHKVTMVSGYKSSDKLHNYNEIVIDGIADDLLKKEMMHIENKMNQFEIFRMTMRMSKDHVRATFRNKEISKMIENKQKFDLVICDLFYNDANLYFGHVFDAPVIIMSSFGHNVVSNMYVGSSLPFSYVPGLSTQTGERMTLFQRMKMTLFNSMLYVFFEYEKSNQRRLLKKMFGNVPTMEEMYDNVALVLSNSHYSIETVRPYTANVVPIAGFHIENAKPIEKELSRIMNCAKHGFIYFSLGSQIRTCNLRFETLSALMESFAKINQTVLWKFERAVDFTVPKNVIIRKWFPQDAILSHPNIRAFITHGGVLSMIEAIHYAVPMIVVPFVGDQHTNAKFVESRSLGRLINLEEINEGQFSRVLNDVIDNPRYRQNVSRYSQLLRHQPIKPLDAAIFWVEHVIKFKDCSHLKPYSLKLPWYKYYLIDVLLTFGILSVILFIFTVFIIKFVYCLVKQIYWRLRAPDDDDDDEKED